MDLTDLSLSNTVWAARPHVGLLVDPARRLAVGLGLQPLLKFVLASADDAVLKEQLDLLQPQRIALDSRRVVRLFRPNTSPDVLEDRRLRQSADNHQVVTRLV